MPSHYRSNKQRPPQTRPDTIPEGVGRPRPVNRPGSAGGFLNGVPERGGPNFGIGPGGPPGQFDSNVLPGFGIAPVGPPDLPLNGLINPGLINPGIVPIGPPEAPPPINVGVLPNEGIAPIGVPDTPPAISPPLEQAPSPNLNYLNLLLGGGLGGFGGGGVPRNVLADQLLAALLGGG